MVKRCYVDPKNEKKFLALHAASGWTINDRIPCLGPSGSTVFYISRPDDSPFACPNCRDGIVNRREVCKDCNGTGSRPEATDAPRTTTDG